MPFLEQRLDPRITDGARCISHWLRVKAYTGSGHLSQDFRWAHSKLKLDLSYRPRTREEFQALEDFFHVVFANAFTGFRVKNWADFAATQENTSAVLVDGVWQLCRLRSAAGAVYHQPIKKPIEPVIVYDEAGAELAGTVDYTAGTFEGAGTPFSWSGEFDMPMTFVNDQWVGNFLGTAQDMWISPEPIMLETILNP